MLPSDREKLHAAAVYFELIGAWYMAAMFREMLLEGGGK